MESYTPSDHNEKEQQQRDPQEALLTSNIENLRAEQFAVLRSDDYDGDKAEEIDSQIDRYLSNYGVDENRERLRLALRRLSADRIDEHTWRYGDWRDDERTELGPIGRDLVHAEQIKLYGTRLDLKPISRGDDEEGVSGAEDRSAAESSEGSEQEGLTPEQRTERIASLESELPELAKKKHDAHLKLMTARMLNRKERQAAFDEANHAYAAAVNELLRLKAHDKSPEDRKAFYETEVNRLHSEDNDAQHQYMLGNGGKKVKFLEKYSKMSAKEKFKFGAKLAGAALAGGVVLGIAAGAVGTAGVAVVAGRKGFNWFKSYELAKADLFKKHDVGTFEYDVDDDNDEEQLATYYRNENEAVSERNEKVRRKARTVALGGLAVGSVAGLAGGVLGTALHTGTIKSPVASIGHSGSTNDHWKAGIFEDINAPDGNDVHGNVGLSHDDINDHLPKSNLPDSDATGGGHEIPSDPDFNGDSIPAPDDSEVIPYQGSTTDQLFDSLNENAHMITRGEGLLETFAEHGVPKEHWNELLGELGPKLDAEYPGLVYPDPSIGGWGFAHTGKLPEGASRMILDAANSHGWAHVNPMIVTG